VVQEASLAPKGLCHYGNLEVPLHHILKVATWLYHKIQHLPFGWNDHPNLQNAYYTWLSSDTDYINFSVYKPDMHQLLDRLHGFHAYEARDHVYGLLGLHQKFRPTATAEPPPLLAPDYEKPLALVLRDATRFAIMERHDLSCLRDVEAGRTEECLGLLSWVRKWHVAWDGLRDPAELSHHDTAYGEKVQYLPALDDTHSRDDSDVLSAEGVSVDSVLSIAMTVNPDTTATSFLESVRAVE
jgi:hypothetical protein